VEEREAAAEGVGAGLRATFHPAGTQIAKAHPLSQQSLTSEKLGCVPPRLRA
jgi:hypothetical protein